MKDIDGASFHRGVMIDVDEQRGALVQLLSHSEQRWLPRAAMRLKRDTEPPKGWSPQVGELVEVQVIEAERTTSPSTAWLRFGESARACSSCVLAGREGRVTTASTGAGSDPPLGCSPRSGTTTSGRFLCRLGMTSSWILRQSATSRGRWRCTSTYLLQSPYELPLCARHCVTYTSPGAGTLSGRQWSRSGRRRRWSWRRCWWSSPSRSTQRGSGSGRRRLR